MKVIYYKVGNLLEAKEDIIVQSVNCKGLMGAGLAKQIRAKYPNIYKNYREYFLSFENKKDLLGKVQISTVEESKYVANIFGQYDIGRNKSVQYVDYDALSKGLQGIRNFAECDGKSVALPFGLGCGLANGSWEIVSKIIDEAFDGYNVTIYKLG